MADQNESIHVLFAESMNGEREHHTFNNIGEFRLWLLNEHGDGYFESGPIRATIEAEHPDNGGGVTIYMGEASFL